MRNATRREHETTFDHPALFTKDCKRRYARFLVLVAHAQRADEMVRSRDKRKCYIYRGKDCHFAVLVVGTCFRVWTLDTSFNKSLLKKKILCVTSSVYFCLKLLRSALENIFQEGRKSTRYLRVRISRTPIAMRSRGFDRNQTWSRSYIFIAIGLFAEAEEGNQLRSRNLNRIRIECGQKGHIGQRYNSRIQEAATAESPQLVWIKL